MLIGHYNTKTFDSLNDKNNFNRTFMVKYLIECFKAEIEMDLRGSSIK